MAHHSLIVAILQRGLRDDPEVRKLIIVVQRSLRLYTECVSLEPGLIKHGKSHLCKIESSVERCAEEHGTQEIIHKE